MNCPYCGAFGHQAATCWRVAAIEYHPNGALKRVELRPLGEVTVRPEMPSIRQPERVEG